MFNYNSEQAGAIQDQNRERQGMKQEKRRVEKGRRGDILRFNSYCESLNDDGDGEGWEGYGGVVAPYLVRVHRHRHHKHHH